MKSPCLRYPSMIRDSPFQNGGWGCTDLDSTNWWQTCCPHPFSLLEIDCSRTEFLQKAFWYEFFLLQPFSRDFESPPQLQIFLLEWDEFPLVAAAVGVEKERKWIWYPFTISKILWPFVRSCHFFTKCFSLSAIWTFGSWTYKNNLFTSMWAYGNFSQGIRVGLSLKNIVPVCIFRIVLVIPVEVPAVLLDVVFVRT